MRPEVLFPLYAPVQSLKGVGPTMVKTLKRLQMNRVVDMLWHLPTGVSHYPLKQSLKGCQRGDHVAVLAEITAYEVPFKKGKNPFKVVCEVGEDQLALTFFKVYSSSLEKRLPIGQKRLICGTLELFHGTWQMSHPERILAQEAVNYWKEKSPLYPLTAGLSQPQAQWFIQEAVKRAPDLPEWIPGQLKKEWPSWQQALQQVHTPQTDIDLDPSHAARQRLAFDELYADQLSLGLIRRRHPKGKSIVSEGKLKEKILEAFGHPLTPGQEKALHEIETDLAMPSKMIRLLQGDVGSGKTLVAFLAISHAIEAGYQAAILVPTEVLASQHAQALASLGEKVGIKVALLTSKQKSKKEIYQQISKGEVDLVIGTHALLQDAVKFANLGLVVIDEQHRFGVEQRVNLTAKGDAVDLLVMTATPIPRTLSLTAYGDLDVSRILDKPKGRKPIQTRVISLERLDEVVAGIRRLTAQNKKIYWVCPLVEESETLDLAAATDRYDFLHSIFGGDIVGLIHGRQMPEEKKAIMTKFKEGACQILVSTTVIEVGIDVPDATVMVIEHAERFGLSQLHQLRGRVGRGNTESSCILLYGFPLTFEAKKRLEVIRKTEDGFLIAEEDLALRGRGDVLGTKQSGLPSYRLADPITSGPLLEKAFEAAQDLLQQDPRLESPQGQAARVLLYLFGQEKVIHTLTSG